MFVVWYSVLVLFHQAGDITASVSWPKGTYGLLKPKTGCPGEWEEKQWEQYGLINQDTAYYNSNERSNVLHIDGYVYNSIVKRYFCIKNTSWTGPKWPKGQYCVHSNDQLIKGIHPGSIRMHNEWYQNKDYVSISCKDYFVNISSPEEWNKYIELYFACDTSGNKKIPISLPITKPFYLLPYGSRDCQQVKWMVATTEWIKYQTRDYIKKKGKQTYGEVPYHELGDINHKGITMFYCYYESCNHTLNNTKGAFQSPGFPGKYPDGQLCSWRIMVPDNHNLVVNFTKFSLYEYDKDCLQLYEYDSRIFKPKQAHFGHRQPFTIKATSDVMFVFRSDEENNSTGFSANYAIFKTPERTTTKPSITTTRPITTTKPTTQLITTQPPTTKQVPTTLPTTKRPITREATTTFPPTTNVNSTTNDTTTKDKAHDKSYIHPSKKTCSCDETWRIVVMVIPLAVFILIVLVTIDIFCRYRYKKALKSGTAASSADDGMVVNPTYERGNIILDQSAHTVTNETTVPDQQQSRDEPPVYEDVDYTQLNEIPPTRRSSKCQECHALQPVDNDTSSVFYYVLEPPKIESDQPESQVSEPVGTGAPEVFYHTLEPPTGSSDQNLSEVNQYTVNPVYESAENSAPLVEANKLYDNYIA